MKQTAVEWLLQRFEDGDLYNVEDAQFIKHQAKQMHKEEIEIAHEIGYINGGNAKKVNGEQYYNETYKGGQNGC